MVRVRAGKVVWIAVAERKFARRRSQVDELVRKASKR
jgi:hypothetical protein